MNIKYIKPEIKSYSTDDILEFLGPCQSQYTVTLNSAEGPSGVNIDGTIYSDGTVYYSGVGISAGDTEDDLSERGFAGFNISPIPSGSTIVSATLRLYQAVIAGTPYTDFTNSTIVVDHVNFGTDLTPGIPGDYGTANGSDALQSNIDTISNNATLEWKTISVKNQVQNDLNAGRTSSQFRLRFSPIELSSPLDSETDDVGFEDADNSAGTGNRPALVITYR